MAFPYAAVEEVAGEAAWFLRIKNHLVSNSVSHCKKVMAAAWSYAIMASPVWLGVL